MCNQGRKTACIYLLNGLQNLNVKSMNTKIVKISILVVGILIIVTAILSLYKTFSTLYSIEPISKIIPMDIVIIVALIVILSALARGLGEMGQLYAITGDKKNLFRTGIAFSIVSVVFIVYITFLSFSSANSLPRGMQVLSIVGAACFILSVVAFVYWLCKEKEKTSTKDTGTAAI